jgi:hypothetical protein
MCELYIPWFQELLLFLFSLLFILKILSVVCFDIFGGLCCRLIKARIIHAACFSRTST